MTKILYIEDNEFNRDMLSQRLEMEGFQVILEEDGLNGIETAKREKPDLILMDMSLPLMDGWEATRSLKSDPQTRDIPVVALTAHAMVGDKDKALEAGCDDYDTKPVDINSLLPKIRGQLGQTISPAEPSVETSAGRPAPSIGQQPTHSKIPLEQQHILIIDDDEDILELLSSTLKIEGYDVSLGRNGSESLKMIQQGEFDLVLLDLKLPDINGFEVLQILRKDYSMAELPVMIITGRHLIDNMAQALRLGANGYFTKPLHIMSLLDHMKSQLMLHNLAKLKDRFLSIASHDLKNPLVTVMGYAALMKREMRPGDQVTKDTMDYITRIHRASQVIHHIITDFLDFQMLQDGHLKLSVEDVDFTNLVRDEVSNQEDIARKKGIELAEDLAPDIPTLKIDPMRIIQVIQNLLTNAVKFTPENGRIVVQTRKLEDGAVLEVSDSGPGLTPEDMKNVFQKFTRLSAQPTGGEKSSGLGLYICKQLIEAHSGDIGVRNNPGGGATFWFRLPF